MIEVTPYVIQVVRYKQVIVAEQAQPQDTRNDCQRIFIWGCDKNFTGVSVGQTVNDLFEYLSVCIGALH